MVGANNWLQPLPLIVGTIGAECCTNWCQWRLYNSTLNLGLLAPMAQLALIGANYYSTLNLSPLAPTTALAKSSLAFAIRNANGVNGSAPMAPMGWRWSAPRWRQWFQWTVIIGWRHWRCLGHHWFRSAPMKLPHCSTLSPFLYSRSRGSLAVSLWL